MDLPTVHVPHLVGQFVHIARDEVRRIGLDLGGDDPDGTPITAATWPGLYRVTSQTPEAGAVAHRGDLVRIAFVPDGQTRSGVPAPPPPRPPSLRAEATPESP